MKNKTNKPKYIVVTGGVISGLGKGVSAAAIGNLLKARGFKVFNQKLDPYLNTDPGTISPYEHGEVYVTNDGSETDLDLGHYERFTGNNVSKFSNFTTAKILMNLFKKERSGFFNGKTAQIIPHLTDEIENLIRIAGSSSDADFVIIEIGGTVGDIESLPFIASLARMNFTNPQTCLFIHNVYLPFLESTKEFKTKPIQVSISKMRELSINPNMLLVRSGDKPLNEIKEKISKMSAINLKDIILVPDIKNIYEIPLKFEEDKVVQNILNYFNISSNEKPNLDSWIKYIDLFNKEKKHKMTIAMIGKYINFKDAYLSILEAIDISSNYESADINFKWINAEKISTQNVESELAGVDGIVMLPGMCKEVFEGMITVSAYGREKDIPTLGICLGMQAMVAQQARAKGIKDAASKEFSNEGTLILDLIKTDKLPEGSFRLGAHTTILDESSLAYKIYNTKEISERHRHKYEVNKDYIEKISDNQFKFSGFDKETNIVEICELKDKRFYLGVQYHPEFNATPLKPSLLFSFFLKSIIKNG